MGSDTLACWVYNNNKTKYKLGQGILGGWQAGGGKDKRSLIEPIFLITLVPERLQEEDVGQGSAKVMFADAAENECLATTITTVCGGEVGVVVTEMEGRRRKTLNHHGLSAA